MKEVSPEFQHPERVDDLADGEERAVAFSADDAERAALARRFGVVAIDRLEAEGTLRRFGAMVRAELRLRAAATQTCVVTLAPVPAAIDEPVVLTFAPDQVESAAEVDLDVDDDDPPEPMIDGAIELGEPLAEALGLALDPYPRAPGATFEGWQAHEADEPAPDAPFAVLSRLRK
jgi:uncharacterized metal-binding protein YceD (DUF177 family)